MDDYFELKAGFAILLALIAILAIVYIFESNHDTTTWNNGYHALDGGRWEYLQLIGRGSHDIHYIYKCSKCGKIIELLECHQEVEE